MPNRQPSSSAPAPAATTHSLPPRVHRLLEKLLRMLSPELARELDRVLVSLEVELEQLARMARNPALQAGHMALLGNVQRQREGFIPGYLRALEAGVYGIRRPTAGPRPDVPTVRAEDLRLVDHVELGEDTVLDAIGDRLEGRARLPLLLLGQRFGVLAGAPAFSARDLPVGPHRMARLLADAATGLGLERDARTRLYRIFERQLVNDYAMLVESMNQLLERNDVLPGLTFVPLRRSRRPVQSPTRRPDDEAAQDTDAAAPAAGRTGGFAGPVGQEANAPAGGAADFTRLRELLAARRSQATPRDAAPAAPRVALDTGEVDSALGTLQARSSDTPAAHGVAEIRQALLAQSRLRLGQPAVLSPKDHDTFELLGLLHSGIGHELRPDSPNRLLVDRLQVPLLRVALQDHEFFLQPRHPARELLNTVAEPGARWLDDEADPQLTAHLQQAVDHVVRHYDGDAAVFEAANRTLREHLRRSNQKAEISERRHVEAARGREKLVLAKQEAQAVVDRAIGDASPPRFLRNLLDQAWVDVLTLVLLRHGHESAEWNAHVADTGHIVDASLHGRDAPEGVAARVSHALSLVGYHGAETEAITRRLTGAPETDDDAASRTELAMKLKARTRVGGTEAPAQPVQVPPRTPREQEFYDHLCTLPFGSWIELPGATGGEVVRRRLAWFSPRTGHALFVNQRGQKVEDGSTPVNLDPVARLFAAGKARVVGAERGGLVDRAWQATLSMLRGLASNRTEAGR